MIIISSTKSNADMNIGIHKKMTAIQWLVEQIKSDHNQKALSPSEWMEVIEQAKQMEKEQMQIQLPSDEEIEKAANTQSHYEGAMWLKYKILNQNK